MTRARIGRSNRYPANPGSARRDGRARFHRATGLAAMPCAALLIGAALASSAQGSAAQGSAALASSAQGSAAQGSAALASSAQGSAAAGPAAASPALENITVLVDGYRLFASTEHGGEDDEPTHFRARLESADGTRIAEASAAPSELGSLELAFTTGGAHPRRPIIIRPEHTISIWPEAASEGLSTDGSALRSPHDGVIELEVPRLSATPDVAADSVTGVAPPGGTIIVTAGSPEGGFASRTATADPDGRWRADFSGDRGIDLIPGSSGAALITGDDVTYQAAWAAMDVDGRIGDPQIALFVRESEVVSASLADDGGAVVAAATGVAWSGGATLLVLRDADGRPRPLLGPGQLHLSFRDADPTVIALPRLDVTVSASAGRVTVSTAPGSPLRAEADGVMLEALAGEDGGAEFDFEGAGIDLAHDTAVEVSIPGSPLAARFAYEAAVETIDPLEAAVAGRGTAGEPVELLATDDSGEEVASGRTWVGAEGTFEAVARLPGGTALTMESAARERLRLGVRIGGLESWLPAAPMTVRAHSGSNAVSGTAAPGAAVEVVALGASRRVEAGADGAWSVSLDDAGWLRPGTPVRVEAQDPGLTGTHLAHAVARLEFEVFRASAQLDSTRVRIEGHPGLEATAEVERDGNLVAVGTCRVSRGACDAHLVPAGEGGAESVAGFYRIEPGDAVFVLPSYGSSASFTTVPLTAHIDRGGLDVVGISPAGRQVRIEFANERGVDLPLGTTIDADEMGVYDYELSASQWSLMVPGLVAEVTYDLPDGHRLLAVGVLEVVRISAGGSRVSGLAEPGQPVTGTVLRESVPVAWGSGSADADGAFDVPLVGDPVAGEAFALRSGDELRLAHARATVIFRVPPLGAWTADPSGAMAGVTLPAMPIRAVHRWLPVPEAVRDARTIAARAIALDGTAAADGGFHVLPGSIDPAEVSTREVVAMPVRDAEIVVDVTEARPYRIALPSAAR